VNILFKTQGLSRRDFLAIVASGALGSVASAQNAHATPLKDDSGICAVPVLCDDEVWVGQSLVHVGTAALIRLPVGICGSLPALKAKLSMGENTFTQTIGVRAEADTQGKETVLTFDPLPKQLLRESRSNFAAQMVDIHLQSAERPVATVRLAVHDSARACTFPQCEVRVMNGVSAPFVNGEPCGCLTAIVAHCGGDFRPKSIRQFAQAGVGHFNIFTDMLGCWRDDDTFDLEAYYGQIERTVLRIMAQAPESRFLLRWHLYVPPWWLERYPNEVIALDTGGQSLQNTPGKRLQASYASPTWRTRASAILEAALRRIGQSPLADRFIGVRLAYGNCGEWNNWGYHEKSFPDYSPAMQRAFGGWLRSRYPDVDALRAAWANASADFSGDVVPAREVRFDPADSVPRTMPDHTQAADYYTFWQEWTADTIEHFAKSVKQATDNRCFAGSFYGYYVGHLGAGPYHFQDSGHYALGRLLESPWVDFLGGPYPYEHRLRNCALNGAFSSFPLHGKLWDSENDQRTHRSGEGNRQYGTTADLNESIAVAKRDFINNLVKGSSYYFFDFVQGWYQDEPFMAAVKRLKEIDRFSLRAGRQNRSEVAVFVSETTVPLLANDNPAMRALSRMLLWEIDSVGAPWSLYLMSDIPRVDLSHCKLAIVANAYAVTDEELASTREILCASGRTVAFLHAPGVLSWSGFDLKRSKLLTGFDLAIDDTATLNEVTLNVDNSHMKWTGDRCRPLITVADTGAKALGFANGGKKVAVAERKAADHRALFLACPGLTAPWLRWLYERAGVHLYSEVGEPFFASGPFFGLYSRTGGEKTIRFPSTVEMVADLFSGEALEYNTDRITVSIPKKRSSTILLYAGQKQALP